MMTMDMCSFHLPDTFPPLHGGILSISSNKRFVLERKREDMESMEEMWRQGWRLGIPFL
jgi:ferredoxin